MVQSWESLMNRGHVNDLTELSVQLNVLDTYEWDWGPGRCVLLTHDQKD